MFVCECSGLARRSLHRLIVHLVRLSDWYSLVGFLGLFNGPAKPVVVIFSVLRSGVERGLMFAEKGVSGVCCFVLSNLYWGIVTVLGSFLKSGDLGWPDSHPLP